MKNKEFHILSHYTFLYHVGHLQKKATHLKTPIRVELFKALLDIARLIR